MRFKNKTVLITGSSRNTGLGIAEAFLSEGAFVYINGTTAEGTHRAAEILQSKGLTNFYELPGRICNSDTVKKFFEIIKEKSGGIDILVNNACQQGIGPSFEQVTFSAFEEVIQTNILGTFYVSSCAVDLMLQYKPVNGVIVNVGSNVSMRAIHNRVAYCTSKGGIDAMTSAMAIDLGPLGIRVNCVAPGYIFTERWEILGEDKKARRRLNTPIGTEATAKDIAEAVMFFASDASRNICGERLLVDGGTSAQHMPIDVDV